MARIITKELALKIADKLKAVKTSIKGRPHDIYRVFYNGLYVTEFGVRHGSSRDQGHDHVPEQIFLGPNKARRLGQCSVSYEQWIEILQGKNIIPRDAADEAAGS